MNNLKVGDRVEIVKECEFTEFKIGDVGTISQINEDSFYNIQVTNEISFDVFHETEIKKIEGDKVKMDKLMNIEDMKGLTNNEYLIQETRKVLELPNQVTDEDIVDIIEYMEYSDEEKFAMFVGAIMLGNPVKLFEEFSYYESYKDWFKEVDTVAVLSQLVESGEEVEDLANLLLPKEYVKLSNGGMLVFDDSLSGYWLNG